MGVPRSESLNKCPKKDSKELTTMQLCIMRRASHDYGTEGQNHKRPIPLPVYVLPCDHTLLSPLSDTYTRLPVALWPIRLDVTLRQSSVLGKPHGKTHTYTSVQLISLGHCPIAPVFIVQARGFRGLNQVTCITRECRAGWAGVRVDMLISRRGAASPGTSQSGLGKPITSNAGEGHSDVAVSLRTGDSVGFEMTAAPVTARNMIFWSICSTCGTALLCQRHL